jgi:hypothetical protein
MLRTTKISTTSESIEVVYKRQSTTWIFFSPKKKLLTLSTKEGHLDVPLSRRKNGEFDGSLFLEVRTRSGHNVGFELGAQRVEIAGNGVFIKSVP